MVQAALGAIGTLFGGQEKRPATPRQPVPTASTALATIHDAKQAKRITKEVDKERLLYLLTQPEVVGILTTLAGIYAANNLTFSDNEGVNAGLRSTATTASVLIGLGNANVGDLTTSIVAGLAGIFSLFGNIPEPDLGNDWYKYLFPFGGIWSLLT